MFAELQLGPSSCHCWDHNPLHQQSQSPYWWLLQGLPYKSVVMCWVGPQTHGLLKPRNLKSPDSSLGLGPDVHFLAFLPKMDVGMWQWIMYANLFIGLALYLFPGILWLPAWQSKYLNNLCICSSVIVANIEEHKRRQHHFFFALMQP